MRQVFDIASVRTRLPAFLASRHVAWLIVGIVVLLVLFKVALPLFISTASVKANMERALSSWTGAQARIGGAPEISFWPHPVLTLHRVTFEGGDAATPELLAKADAIAAGFDLLAALRGNPVFYDFRLISPVLHVERRTDGRFNWRRAGWMADAVAGAQAKVPTDAVHTPIGDIEIENGTLEFVDHITTSAYRLTAVSGTVEWPTPTARINANLSALMNGQKIEWSLSCDAPVALLSGENSAIATSFTSGLLTASFEGIGNGSDHAFASGQLHLSTGSIPGLAAWYGAKVPATAPAAGATIDTTITLSGETLKMDNLSLAVDSASATGVLDIAWHRPSPRIDGTLAFDRLDLQSLFQTIRPLLASPETSAAGVDTTPLTRISLDLRLSAEQADYGPIVLTDVAAGIMADKGRASIDIGDAGYAGGSLSGRAALTDGGATGGQLQASLKNADLAPIVSILGLQGPMPLGRGILSVDLATTEPLSALTTTGISGEVRYTANEGTLTNFNLTEFERLISRNTFFNIDQAGDGSFAFTTAEIVATLKRGVAELTKADIRGEDRTLSLAGAIPYKNGSLALAGAIRTVDTTLAPLRFFIGGSWPNPIISPLSMIPAPQ